MNECKCFHSYIKLSLRFYFTQITYSIVVNLTTIHLFCVNFVEILIEQFLYVLEHRWEGGVDDLWRLRGVGVVEGILHQASLSTIQVLHPLLTNHDFLRGKKIN